MTKFKHIELGDRILESVCLSLYNKNYEALTIYEANKAAGMAVYVAEQVLANNPTTGTTYPQNVSTTKIWQRVFNYLHSIQMRTHHNKKGINSKPKKAKA